MNAPASARLPALGERLVVASHNPGKVREIADLVRPYGLSVVTAGELGLDEPEEIGATFEENAALKALTAARASGLPALADDSGLAVDALGGAPGIYSARWAGPDKDFAIAMRLVEDRLQALGATTPEQRTAQFRRGALPRLSRRVERKPTVARSRGRWSIRRAAPAGSATTRSSCQTPTTGPSASCRRR